MIPEGPTATSGSSRPADGEYLVTMTDQLKKGGPDYTYRVEVTPGHAQARREHAQRIAPPGHGRAWRWPCRRGTGRRS